MRTHENISEKLKEEFSNSINFYEKTIKGLRTENNGLKVSLTMLKTTIGGNTSETSDN